MEATEFQASIKGQHIPELYLVYIHNILLYIPVTGNASRYHNYTRYPHPPCHGDHSTGMLHQHIVIFFPPDISIDGPDPAEDPRLRFRVAVHGLGFKQQLAFKNIFSPSGTQCAAGTYRKIAQNLKALVGNGTLGAPGLLRVGFHSCVTGIAYAKVNGCMGGWLQHKVDAEFEANNGINDRCG